MSFQNLVWDPIELKRERALEIEKQNKENELKKQKNKKIGLELRKQHYKILNDVKKRNISSLNLNSIKYKEKIQEKSKIE